MSLSLSKPFKIMSSCFCLLKVLKLGIKCSKTPNIVRRASLWAVHVWMKWLIDSLWNLHFGQRGDSVNWNLKLCAFKYDRPTRIWVSSLFATLSARDKNLYLFGARCNLSCILKSLWSRSFLILCGRDSYFFEKRIKKRIIIFLFTYRKRRKDSPFSCVIVYRGC